MDDGIASMEYDSMRTALLTAEARRRGGSQRGWGWRSADFATDYTELLLVGMMGLVVISQEWGWGG